MKYTLLSLGLVAVFSLSACDDGKVFGDGLDEKTLISEIELTNVENGKLTLAATVDYTDSLITYKYSPEQPSNPKVKWTSSNEKVATVSQDGLVHAVSAGKANIMITPEVGFGATALFELTVVPEFKPITDFEFTEADKAELFVSEERTLKPIILPADRTYSTITWKSSDTSIATVTKDGVVEGLDGGEEGRTVTITAISLDRGGYEESFELKIIPIIYIDEIIFGTQADLLPGESMKLNFTTSPENATVASLDWSSSDPNVVEVSDQGVVTAKNYGEVTITATTTEKQKFTTTVKVPYGLMKYSFEETNKPWYANNAADKGEVKDGKYVLNMKLNNTRDKQRADLSLINGGKLSPDLSESEKSMKVYVNTDYSIVAIKLGSISFEKGKTDAKSYPTIKFDVVPKEGAGFGEYGNNANTFTGKLTKDGAEVIYYDIKNGTFKGSSLEEGTTELKTFQFKIEAPGASTSFYDVYWVRTFKTLDDLKAFVEQENKN